MNIGQIAPTFTAPVGAASPVGNRNRKTVTLQDFGGRWLVLYFYPKDNTPGCTTEAIEFSAKLAEFQAIDTQIVGISPDSIVSHDKFIDKHQLTVTLVSDPEHQIAEAYGVWQLKKFMGKEYMGIVRSTFLIDPTGKIAKVWSNVRVKNHVDDVLAAVKSLSTDVSC